jgi:hypothetical protein
MLYMRLMKECLRVGMLLTLLVLSFCQLSRPLYPLSLNAITQHVEEGLEITTYFEQ